MSLVERLGYKTLDNLYKDLDNNDIMEWAAFDMTQDPDTSAKLKAELNLEYQKMTPEEEAERITKLFMGL